MSPTALSLRLLRRQGWLACIVERRLPIDRFVTVDAFGVGDILACHPHERKVMLVQTTSARNAAHRVAKAKARPELAGWLRAGGNFQVWAWSKRSSRWEARIIGVAGEDLEPVVLQAPRRRMRQNKQQRGLFDTAEAG
jgi:hypothetical protein